jgi:ribosomal subunit interface protein
MLSFFIDSVITSSSTIKEDLMNTQITFRHFKGSLELQSYIKDLVAKLGKFNDSITGAHIILESKKKNILRAEIILSVLDKSICVSCEEDNIRKAVDKAYFKAERQLKKENQKLKGHRAQKLTEIPG